MSGQDNPSKNDDSVQTSSSTADFLAQAADEQMALLLTTMMTGKIPTFVASTSDSSVSHSWEEVVSRVGAGVFDASIGVASSSYLPCSNCVAPGNTCVKLCAVGDTGLKTG